MLYKSLNINAKYSLGALRYPLVAYLKITTKCMLNCTFCSQRDTEVVNVLNKLSPLLQLGKYHIIRPAALFSLPYFVQSDLDKLSFSGFLFFLAMHANEISRAEKICKEEIASSYCTIQEKKFYNKILRHSSTLERFILRNRYTLKLPACPECYRCKCKNSCKYEKWKIYATNLLLACKKQIVMAHQ